jgi:acetoin utilization protein AcuB
VTTTSGIEVIALTAGDVMSTPVMTITPTASLWEAWRLMMGSGLRHLVVSYDDEVLGVIDDRAVFAQWPMGPLALRRTHVADVMRPRTSCVLANVDARLVAEVMIADATDAVPVVDELGQVIGIVTASDLTCAVATHGLCRG